jgi:hypothetical protein
MLAMKRLAEVPERVRRVRSTAGGVFFPEIFLPT